MFYGRDFILSTLMRLNETMWAGPGPWTGGCTCLLCILPLPIPFIVIKRMLNTEERFLTHSNLRNYMLRFGVDIEKFLKHFISLVSDYSK